MAINIPINDVHFEDGTLTFNILLGGAYFPEIGKFAGGGWTKAHLEKEGKLVNIKLDGANLVIETCDNGKIIEIDRFSICE